MQNLGRIIGKYFVSIFLIIIGLGLLLLSKDQTPLFKLGGFAIFIVGVLGILYIKGIISRIVQIVAIIVVASGAVAFAFLDYDAIDSELKYQEKKKLVESHIIQRLKDIRKAQLAYLKENGKYAASFDSLEHFLKYGEIGLVKRLGALPDSVPTDEMARELGLISQMPDSMTEAQVIAAGMIIRDTIQVPVMANLFDEDDAKSRKAPFKVDSLAYVPFSNHKFELNTGQIESGGVTQPVFEVFDPKPFAEMLKVGSLTEGSTAGNWNE